MNNVALQFGCVNYLLRSVITVFLPFYLSTDGKEDGVRPLALTLTAMPARALDCRTISDAELIPPRVADATGSWATGDTATVTLAGSPKATAFIGGPHVANAKWRIGLSTRPSTRN